MSKETGTFNVSLPFRFGKIKAEVKSTGRYAELDGPSHNTLVSASVATLLQLPHWLQIERDFLQDDSSGRRQDRHDHDSRQDNQPGRRQDESSDRSNEVTSVAKNGHGTIEVRVIVKDQRGRISGDILQMVANATAATLQNHGDSAIAHMPAANDPFVLIQRYLASRENQHVLINAGAESSSSQY